MATFYWQQHVMAHLPRQHSSLPFGLYVTTPWRLPYAMAVPVQAW